MQNEVDMDTGKLQWFVQWNSSYRGWEVMLGGFRDSWYKNKYLAEQRRDFLNREVGTSEE